jgi:hypothetical protein
MQEAGREMEEIGDRLFAGVRKRRIEIELLEETYQQALELLRANHWDEAEGLLIIFANGLAFLRGERQLMELAPTTGATGEAWQRLMDELIHLQSMYSVMKFRAFVLQQDNEALGFQNTGYREENRALVRRLERSRADEERLRARIRELEEENERLRHLLGPVAEAGAQERGHPRAPLRDLLKRWLRWK